MNFTDPKNLFATAAALVVLGFCAAAFAGLAPPNYNDMPISDEEPETDAEFPDPVVLTNPSVSRSDGSEGHSKAGIGWLSFDIEGYEPEYAGGDEAPYGRRDEGLEDAEYGLRFDVEGQHPYNFPVPEDPVVILDPADGLHLHWNDSSTYDEPIDVTITATWIDEYGREGPTSDPMEIINDGLVSSSDGSSSDESSSDESSSDDSATDDSPSDGSASGGCSATRSSSAPAGIAVIILLLLALSTHWRSPAEHRP